MINGLTLEKQRIGDRLESLEKSFSTYMAINELVSKQNKDMIEKLNEIIVGNGKEGIAETVRNLKRMEDNRRKHYFAFYVGIIGTICEGIYRTITQWGK